MSSITITPDNIPKDYKNYKIIKLRNFFGVVNLDLTHCEKLDCCFNNEITSLPDLPFCETLFCFSNQLTSLPELPMCKILDCCDNQLTNLPNLPMCKTMYCSKNQLTSLPDLPLCKILGCSNNQLIYLPELPLCELLYCSNNQLTSLPDLRFCKELVCSNNNLKIINQCIRVKDIDLSNNQLCYIKDIQCETLNLTSNDFNFIDCLNVSKKIVLTGNPLKDYNILQLKQKYPNVVIQFEKKVKVETYKFKYPFDVVFQ